MIGAWKAMLYNTGESEADRRELRALSIPAFCELVAYRYATAVSKTDRKYLMAKHIGR